MNSEKRLLNVQKSILVIGMLYVLACIFLPLSSSCEELANGDFIATYRIGFDHPIYALDFCLISILILLTYLVKDSYIGPIVLCSIGGFITFIGSFLSMHTGGPCMNNPTAFMHFLYLALGMVVFSCFMRIYHFAEMENTNANRKN